MRTLPTVPPGDSALEYSISQQDFATEVQKLTLRVRPEQAVTVAAQTQPRSRDAVPVEHAGPEIIIAEPDEGSDVQAATTRLVATISDADGIGGADDFQITVNDITVDQNVVRGNGLKRLTSRNSNGDKIALTVQSI